MKIHMVKQGDTLYLIAKKYNVSLEDIIHANPEISNPDAISVGMKVKVPSQPKTALEVIHHHIVQQGDSLWKLSKAWGIQLTDMIKANPQLKNPNALLTGEVVNIPKTPNGAASQGATMQGGSLQGKPNTGMIPGMGMKPDTSLKPDTSVQPVPMPLPTPIAPVAPFPAPAPVPTPAPVAPIAEKPTYGFQMYDHVDLFKQYPVPSVKAAVPMEQPYYSDPLPYGYGMQQANVSPETAGVGYDGYGYSHGNPPFGANVAGDLGGLYGNQEYSYSAANNPTYLQGVNSPMSVGAQAKSGCKTCGGPSSWPAAQNAYLGAIPYTDTYPGMGYPAGNAPYGISPAGNSSYPTGNAPYDISPAGNSAYPAGNAPYGVSPAGNPSYPVGNAPYGVSPAGNPSYPVGNAPYGVSPAGNPSYPVGQYGNSPQAISPLEGYPGMHYGAYNGNPVEGIALGGNPSYQGIPGIGGQFAGQGSPNLGYGQQNQPYYGGIPPIPPLSSIPPLPPMPSMPPMGSPLGGYDYRSERVSGSEGDLPESAVVPPIKKQVSKPKLKLTALKQSKPRRKESLPWIKW